MAQPVKYKRPRRINPVSVTVVLVLAALAYLTYQFLPLYLLRHEAFRVLEETGSKFAGSKGRYRTNPKEVDRLRREMDNELRRIGVDDPKMESWIEIHGKKTEFGIVYSKFVHWPFDVQEPHEIEYQVEHALELP